ncbi:ABC-2 type transport system ATP-binding protein [Sinosporangium album]|uniref:ABC-2 type transport system ATP-binding protein n=1 Tax=Sinosporangium album TaxID=504805 RepID=A0A1G8DI32_9ACTN|nr:ABC transporter ATP-binding protein [Sinosporangium album]SDH57010.1 ABC-2 type transport system ATP-binding protein [Sinosporangium album]
MTPAIDIRGLTKQYKDVRAVDDVTFSVAPGEVFGFVGHNGAGKTTTIQMLLGLLRPTAGSARVLGRDVVADSLAVRRISGFLPASYALPRDMTPVTFLAYVASMFGLSGKPVRNKIDELLTMFDLGKVAKKKLGGFSSGMTQKVGLAQALINDPQVLFLDEPSTALDPIGRADLMRHLATLARDKGVTVLFSTHILSDIEDASQRVAILHHGRLLAAGDLAELKAAHGTPRMDDLYLTLVRGAMAREGITP